jgi:subtilisin
LKKTISSLLLVAIILVSSIFVGGAFAAPNEKIPVIVGFKELPDAALIHAHGGDIVYQYSLIKAVACSLPAQAINALQKNPKIAYVEEDFEVTALEYGYPIEDWGITKIGAETLHKTTTPVLGSGIIVGVIDTGINKGHADLTGNYVKGWDFVNNDNDPNDDNGHGTHCAGIIAAAINDVEIAVVGVAPKASIYAYKVLNSRGSGTVSNIIAGIDKAVLDGVDVISLSLGSTSYSLGLETACKNAVSKGVVVVAAAGNSGNTATGSTVNYPARTTEVIAVGATDVSDKLATFSSTGPEVDVVAPGVRILSDYKDINTGDLLNQDTVYMDGTSMACPHVAGTVALMLSVNPSLTPVQIQGILKNTAIDLGTLNFDTYYGYGRIAAIAATESARALLGPDFSISASPSAMTLNAGTSGSSIVTVTSLNGFNGEVSLLGSAPTGLSAAFSPSSLAGGSGLSTLTVTTDSTTNVGTYTVAVTGTSGSLTHSATVTVTVVKPDFSISASPSAMTLKSGAKGTSTITVKSINTFSDTVGLKVTGPTGWTASVNPTSLKPVSGGSATSLLSITVPTSVRTGTFTFTITGTDTSGSLKHSTSVTVKVSSR